MILLEQSADKASDLGEECGDVPDRWITNDARLNLERVAAAVRQASFDISGIHDAIQDVIFRIDELVGDLSVL